MSTKYSQHLRSRSVNEILDGSPGFLVKYGLQLFFAIFIILFALVFFVQLPTPINTEVQICCKSIDTAKRQNCIEFKLPITYQKDFYKGADIAIQFLDDSVKDNKAVCATVISINKHVSKGNIIVQGNLAENQYINTSAFSPRIRHAIVSYNKRLIQLIYRNISPR